MPAARQRSRTPVPTPPADHGAPAILTLDDGRARDPLLAGAKAAALATAAVHGLPVLPGFVVTTAAVDGSAVAVSCTGPLRAAWEELAGPGERALVVRSSSTVEDTSTSSMAGQFTSVLGVRGWPAFLEALASVLASALHPRDAATTSRPMAALVQPELEPVCGGVLFGLDPLTGNRHHVIVEAVPGSPDRLVSGVATAAHVVLGRHGRLLGGHDQQGGALLSPSRRRRLARLARRAAEVFDGPQDVEWAVDDEDRLWLLQSRPVTAMGSTPPAHGAVLGPGPVAETFPDPLRPLEVALWVDPLRAGVAGAIRATSVVGRRRLDASPVVTTVGGRVAADLELFGIVPPGHGIRRTLNPMRGVRRFVAAWPVGRLRAVLPVLAEDLVDTVDSELVAIGDVGGLGDDALVDLLHQSVGTLVALHGHEVLAGMLLQDASDRSSVAAAASTALATGRDAGLSDDRILARYPVALALLPPTLRVRAPLPVTRSGVVGVGHASGRSLGELGSREALRLRCRWLQELTATAVGELGRRLVARGLLDRPELVAELDLAELEAAVLRQQIPDDLATRALVAAGPPLPMAFRLSPAAVPVPVALPDGVDGLPASAGRATGVVCQDADGIPPGEPCVLVVDVLDPRLAPVLPNLAALVCQSGSALSHLAILAREVHLPTVVAVPDARRRFPPGTLLIVDGTVGEVRALEEVGQ